MTRYRILQEGNHYVIDQKWLFFWCRVKNLVDADIKFNTHLDARDVISRWCREEKARVVEEINCES